MGEDDLAETDERFVLALEPGEGFPDTTPTWGTMLQDTSNVAILGDAPWALAPAAGTWLDTLAAAGRATSTCPSSPACT